MKYAWVLFRDGSDYSFEYSDCQLVVNSTGDVSLYRFNGKPSRAVFGSVIKIIIFDCNSLEELLGQIPIR